MITHVNEENFEKEVLKKENIVLVDFFATWCPPCKMVSAELEKIEESRTDLDIVKVDIDDSQNLAIKYNVMYVPTLIVFKNGEVVKSETGYKSAEDILALIEENK